MPDEQVCFLVEESHAIDRLGKLDRPDQLLFDVPDLDKSVATA